MLNFIQDFPTIIHVHDPTLLVVAKKLCEYLPNETKIVYDRHELFEKMHAKLGLGFYQLFEKTSKNSVSGLILVAEGHASSAKKLFPNAIIVTIPNYPSEDDYNNLQIQKKIEATNLQKEIRFVYIGSLRADLDRDINLLLSIAETLLIRYKNISFYIAGHCNNAILQGRLLNLVNLYPERFYYLGFIEREKAIKITQEAHFGFFLIRPDSHYWVKCSPNKVFEYLKCGVVPIIRADVENADQLIEASLIFSRNSSYDEIIEEIIKVIERPAKLTELIQNSRNISTKFTWETVAIRYMDLYNKLIQN
jgi:glycosyltransferase involved in cell wall biosynthesis